jgi:hypothetical protein
MVARGWLRLVVMAVLALGVLAFARARYSSPSPRPEDAPEAEFSAARARAALGRVLEGGAPHPAGSDAAVRARIVAELERAGYRPREQRDFVCGAHAACAFVTNVVAELAAPSRDAVLVSAHYDSVPAAGGAIDDGSGVATLLEAARALKHGPAPERSVLFLFTDAEEDGLLGALAFAKGDPDAGRVRAVVNVDARGSRGPPVVFETSGPSGAVIPLVAQSVPRPVTSWVFLAVYHNIPNDTDFSVLKRDALGANFALFARVADYHSALDRLDHVDAGALQQEGDGALGLLRAFARGEPAGGGEVVWFDVLAFGVVRWPVSWCTPIACLALALVLGAAALRRARLAILAGVTLAPVAAALATSLGVALFAALAAAGAAPAPWTANAAWIEVAMSLAGVALASAAAAFSARAGEEGLWAGVWTAFALTGAVLAVFAPGASYLFVVPALVAGASGLAATLVAGRAPHRALAPSFAAVAAPALVLIVLWSPFFFFTHEAFGNAASPILALGAALATTTCAPLFASTEPGPRAIVPGALVLASLALATGAAVAPRYTAEWPSRVNVIHVEDGASARTLVDDVWGNVEWGPIPNAMRLALGPARVAARFPWSPEPVLQAEAPPAGLAPPRAEVRESAGQRLLVHVRSDRGARAIQLLLPPRSSARFLRVEGREAATAESRAGRCSASWACRTRASISSSRRREPWTSPWSTRRRASPRPPPASRPRAPPTQRRPSAARSRSWWRASTSARDRHTRSSAIATRIAASIHASGPSATRATRRAISTRPRSRRRSAALSARAATPCGGRARP